MATWCPGRTVWGVLKVFLGKLKQADIHILVYGGLHPVFMSGSASAECVTVVLQSRAVISSLSFFSIQWQKVFRRLSLLRLWAPPLSSLRSFQHLFVPADSFICCTHALPLLVFLSVHNTIPALDLCCVHVAVKIRSFSLQSFLVRFQKPQQGSDLTRWSVPHSPSPHPSLHYHILFLVSSTMSKQK